MVNFPNERGPLFRRVLDARNHDFSLEYPAEFIAGGKGVEVYLAREIGFREETEFYVVLQERNNIVFSRISPTGELTEMSKLIAKSKVDLVQKVLWMDPQYRYHLSRRGLPVDGIADDRQMTKEQLISSIIDYFYRKALTISVPKRGGFAEDFSVLTYESIVARFGLLQTLQSRTDIIPDQNTRTLFIKAGDGCAYKCAYCPVASAGGFRPFTLEQYADQVKKTKKALEGILGRRKIRYLDEAFINVSDIALLEAAYRTGKTDLSAKQAASMLKREFPWIEKIGSFVGSLPLLLLPRDPNGKSRRYNYGKMDNDVSRQFLDDLVEEVGGLRLYLGVETAHTKGSYLLNKRIDYSKKQEAAELITSANIKLKAIVQVGVLGKGFYPLDADISPENFVPWHEAADATIQWINQVQPYRVYLSHWQNYGNLPINQLIASGRIVPYDSPEQFYREQKRLLKGIRLRNAAAEIEERYEDFLPGQLGQLQKLSINQQVMLVE